MGGSIDLTDREYKLLLDPRGFSGAPVEALASAFWTRKLKPIIDGQSSDGISAEGELQLKKHRIVRFFDTKKLLLDERRFALRTRVFVKDGAPSGPTEVTLKLRTPDVLLSAEFFDRTQSITDRKFEEDIAPLQISLKKQVTVADPPTTYSRFSVSLNLESDAPLLRLGDAFEHFDGFEEEMESAKPGKVDKDLKLRAGPTICEWVFQEAEVDLGSKVDAEFGFTLWYFVKGGSRRNACRHAASGAIAPDAAEICFDYETKDGRTDAETSRRASRLFKAMRQGLHVNRHATSKTSLALPPLG